MSTVNNALTLKQILLGISESLNEAQNQLRNAKPYDEYGRANTLYTLPYLDFNLQVEAAFDKETNVETKTTGGTANKLNASTLASQTYEQAISFRPVINSVTNKESNKITSTISGRFVAIVPNEGLPQMILQAQPVKTSIANIFEIHVEVFNAAGEKIPNALVEFNYNKQKTEQINNAEIMNHETVFLNSSEIHTDAFGKAKTVVKVDPIDFTKGCILILEVNVGNIFTKISIQK